MRSIYVNCSVPLIVAIAMYAFLFCCSPNNSSEETKVNIFLKSAENTIRSDSLFCFVENSLKIGVCSNSPNNIDSMQVTLRSLSQSGTVSIISLTGFKSLSNLDTLWYTVSLKDTGEMIVSGKAFLASQKQIEPPSIKARISSITLDDTTGPVISLVSGPVSGTSLNNPIVSIDVSVVDPNGIDSIYWTLNGVRRGNLTAGANNIYSLRDSLGQYRANTIIIYACDGAFRHTFSNQSFTYDFNLSISWKQKVFSITINEGKYLSWNLPDSCNNPDNDTLLFSILEGTKSIGAINQKFYNCSPTYSDSGFYSFKIRVTDRILSDTTTMNVRVMDIKRKPSIKATADPAGYSRTIGDSIRFTVSAIDPDSEAVPTISERGLPTHAQFNKTPGAGEFFWLIDDTGSYACVFTAQKDTVKDSLSVFITIRYNDTPRIIRQPKNDTICKGQLASCSCNVSTGGNIVFQWLKNGKDIPGANKSVFSIPAVADSDGAFYRCKVTNDRATIVSDSAKLFINQPAVAATGGEFSPANLCPGEWATVTVKGGSLSLKGRWMWYADAECKTVVDTNGLVNSGASIRVNPDVATTYYVRAEGPCNKTSAAAVLVAPKWRPRIQTQPQAQSVCMGSSVTLTVSATDSGGGSLNYQWYSPDTSTALTANTVYSGVKTASLTITNPTTAENGNYICVINNGVSCPVLTVPALVSVIDLQATSVSFPENLTHGDSIAVRMLSSLSGSNVKVNYKVSVDKGVTWSEWKNSTDDNSFANVCLVSEQANLWVAGRVTIKATSTNCFGPEFIWKNQ